MSASFVEAACRRGERCLFVGFEESVDQVARNMSSVGLDLKQWVEKDLLVHEAWRPSQYGIEMHLLRIHKLIDAVKPRACGHRPDYQPHHRERAKGSLLHAHSPDGLSEGPEHHRGVHESDGQNAMSWNRRTSEFRR